MVGYLASWARAVFFADNLLVNAAFVAVGALAARPPGARGERQRRPVRSWPSLRVYSPLQALTSALFALLILLAFREWFSIRLDA